MEVTLRPSTGFTACAQTFFADAVTAPTNIKTTRGVLYQLDLVNSAAATSYLQVFFMPAASVVLGTTAPDLTIKLPTSAVQPSKTIPFVVPVGGLRAAGQATATGICVAGTTTATGATTVAIGVTAVYL